MAFAAVSCEPNSRLLKAVVGTSLAGFECFYSRAAENCHHARNAWVQVGILVD